MTIEESFEQLEIGLRRLKVQYDLFFMGMAKRQPYEVRKQVDQMIRNVSNLTLKRYHHRFQLNTLVGRYNALTELWGKQLRAQEEGRPIPGLGLAPSPSRREPPAEIARPEGETVVFEVQVRNPESEPDTMKVLYNRYVSARQTGTDRPVLKFESFVKQVATQAANLKASTGCQTLEFRILVKGDAVSLKARAGK